MFGKLDEVVKRHEELTHLLGTVEVASDTKKMIEYNKERLRWLAYIVHGCRAEADLPSSGKQSVH